MAHVEDAGDHFSEVGTGAPGAMAYLTDRFAGLAPPNTCRSAPRTSPPAPACSARRPGPRARLLAGGVRLTTRRISLRGTATTTCDPRLPLATPRITKVSVAIARLVHGRCRFVDAHGRLGRARSCTRPLAMRASGATRWRFTRAVRLPHGTYTVYAWAADSAARRQAHTRPSRRVRV